MNSATNWSLPPKPHGPVETLKSKQGQPNGKRYQDIEGNIHEVWEEYPQRSIETYHKEEGVWVN